MSISNEQDARFDVASPGRMCSDYGQFWFLSMEHGMAGGATAGSLKF